MDCMGATDSRAVIHKDLNPFLANVTILNPLKTQELLKKFLNFPLKYMSLIPIVVKLQTLGITTYMFLLIHQTILKLMGFLKK